MTAHRPIVMGTRGLVSSGHPLASVAAVDVLKTGGNAFDAALCASAVLSVVKSYHCGLGGDLFGIFYLAEKRALLALNGSGRAPRLLPRNLFSEHIPHRGINAATVPGNVDAWCEMAGRLCSRPLKHLLEPAIACASEGFPVFPHLESVIKSSQKSLAADPAWAKIFLPDGRPPRLGDVLIQRDLADSLSRIAAGGRDAFYNGDIARSILRKSETSGGSFNAADFVNHRSRWEEPLRTGYRGREICVPPANSYGLLVLLQLKYLADCDLTRSGYNTAETVTLQVKARDQAWNAGQFWIGDPEQYRREQISELIERFPAEGATIMRPQRAQTYGSDTTYIAAADANGNWASVIQSVHQSFGCGVVVDETGVVLNNRMTGFNLIPGHPNELAPAKRPAHTLSPALILNQGAPVMALGTPGGLGQTQFLTQIICNIFDFGMNIQEAVEAPRWQSEADGHVDLESRFPPDVSTALIRAGYDAASVGPWEFALGGAEIVALHENGQTLMGAADPRREGYAVGC